MLAFGLENRTCTSVAFWAEIGWRIFLVSHQHVQRPT
jgi:hypothetical protein